MTPYKTLNPYFDFYNDRQEQSLYADLVDEEIRLAGTECLYIPKDIESIDKILGEPYKTLYNRFYPMPLRLVNIMGYGGEGDLMSQFGIRLNESSEWIMSKRMFKDLKVSEREFRPLEGDLIMVGPSLGQANHRDPQFSTSLMEITYVKNNEPNFPLGNYFVFKLICQVYVSSYEKFKTNSPDIDRNQTENSNRGDLDLSINDNLHEVKNNLIDFSEDNPFSGL